MRKELAESYQEQEDGSTAVRARVPAGGIERNLIPAEDLSLVVNFADKKGKRVSGKVRLRPVVSEVVRVDTALSSQGLHYAAALNCYSDLSTEELIAKARQASPDEITRFLKNNIVATGHLSVLEHSGPAFIVTGSRAFSHQLVRHRHFHFSQQSQRYVARDLKEDQTVEFPFIIPPAIRADSKMLREYISSVRTAVSGFYALKNMAAFSEDARMLLPNAAATRVLISGNHRSFMEMIPKRTCARAQWEIDIVVTEIARQLHQERPELCGNLGPPCSGFGCDQGKRGCGAPLQGRPLSAFFGDDQYPHDRLIFGMR